MCLCAPKLSVTRNLAFLTWPGHFFTFQWFFFPFNISSFLSSCTFFLMILHLSFIMKKIIKSNNPTTCLYSCYFFLFCRLPCAYPFQDYHWKGREREKRTVHWLLYFRDTKDPNTWSAQSLSWLARAVGTPWRQSSALWGLPPGPSAAFGSWRFPVAWCQCWSSKIGV